MASMTTTTATAETTIQCPRCGSVQRGRADAPTVCQGCGAHLKPPAASAAESPALLSYARPADPVGVACWRYSSGPSARIVIPDGGSTPDRCVRCNAPARGYRKQMKFAERVDSGFPGMDATYHPADLVVAAVFVADVATKLATRKSGVVHLAVCPACRRRATIAWRCALPLALLGVAAILWASMTFGNVGRHSLAWGLAGCIGGAALIVTAIWWAVRDSHLLQFLGIVNGELWFKPNGTAFFSSLPLHPGAPLTA